MKKFIAMVAVFAAVSAFAHEGHDDYRHMVTLSGWENDVQDRSLDFNWGSDDRKNEQEVQNIALNYAYAINNVWQVGAKYKQYTAETNNKVVNVGDESTTWGAFVIYNLAGKLVDTNYVSLGYDMTENEKNDTGTKGNEANSWNLEFGHRFSLGHLWSMDFNWSPSIQYTRTNTDDDAVVGSDGKYTSDAISLNVLKVDVLF